MQKNNLPRYEREEREIIVFFLLILRIHIALKVSRLNSAISAMEKRRLDQ